MRVAADPIHDAALSGEFHRPGECRLRRADHEQRSQVFTHRVRLWRGRVLPRLYADADPRERRHRTPGRQTLYLLYLIRLGIDLGGMLLGAGPGELLRLALLFGTGRGGILPGHDLLPHAVVPAGLPR